MSDTPILFHCPQTRSNTTLWMNEELGAPCAVELIDIRSGAQDTEDYLSINPMGKVPALRHGDTIVTEAAAICAYLADAYSDQGLAPAISDRRRGSYYRWLFFAPGCMEPAMLDKLANHQRENPTAAGHGLVEDVSRTIDHALANGPYLLGEQFSAADIVFGSTLNFGCLFGAFEKTARRAEYLERLMARPAARQATRKNELLMS